MIAGNSALVVRPGEVVRAIGTLRAAGGRIRLLLHIDALTGAPTAEGPPLWLDREAQTPSFGDANEGRCIVQGKVGAASDKELVIHPERIERCPPYRNLPRVVALEDLAGSREELEERQRRENRALRRLSDEAERRGLLIASGSTWCGEYLTRDYLELYWLTESLEPLLAGLGNALIACPVQPTAAAGLYPLERWIDPWNWMDSTRSMVPSGDWP